MFIKSSIRVTTKRRYNTGSPDRLNQHRQSKKKDLLKEKDIEAISSLEKLEEEIEESITSTEDIDN